ncbi:MAG: hypothetical protein IJ106_10770 [Parasporobacterium sp.]|nr:hypothetical protein [Parasporobacterium sp.]
MAAEGFRCTGTFQVSMQDGKDEPQGIRTKRNQDIREQGVGMPAGSAEETGDTDRSLGPLPGGDGDQIPLVRPDPGETPDSTAHGALAGRRTEGGNRPVEELLVGKIDQI